MPYGNLIYLLVPALEEHGSPIGPMSYLLAYAYDLNTLGYLRDTYKCKCSQNLKSETRQVKTTATYHVRIFVGL